MSKQQATIVLLLAAAASTASAQSLLQQHGEVVQASGESVTGLPGVTISLSAATGIPNMDLNGNMIWRAKMEGTGITASVNDQGIFVGRTANDLQLVLQRGANEPTGTLPGVTVTYSATGWDVAKLSPTNNILMFGTTLAGTGITTANDSCILWGPTGSFQFLVREGGTAPSGGATFTGNVSGALNATAINSAGLSVCKVKLIGGDVGLPNGPSSTWGDDALLTGFPGGLGWCVREGDLINGGAQAVGTLDTFNLNMDETGRVIFAQPLSTTLGTSPATSTDDATIMLYTPGFGLSLVMREGDPAPGSGGCLYGQLSSGSGFCKTGLSRSQGWVVFHNSMTGGDVTGNTDDASVFAGQIGSPFTRVARESQTAPTGVPGEVYAALFPNGVTQINDSGTVVFVAQLGPVGNPGLTTFNDVGVFMAKPPYTNPGDVQLIVREGDLVDGLPSGWVIGNTTGGGMTSSGTTLMLNETDTVLISVAGVGDPTAANWGVPALIAWDVEHQARSAYVQGDTFTVLGNPWVTTAAPGFNAVNSSDGGNQSFNNNGDFCVKLFAGSENAVVRGHVGSMVGRPSSVPASGGVAQQFFIDAGPANGNSFYFVLASALGTRPGFPSPIGPQQVPLNFDGLWTNLSISAVNSPIWVNTLGITDANGVGLGVSGFVMPTGFPGFNNTIVHHAALFFDLSITSTYVTEPVAVRLY